MRALVLAVAAAGVLADHDSILSHYHASHHRCEHGHSGLLITLHKDAPSAQEYRADLEKHALSEHKQVNLFHRMHESLGVISMHAIHPSTLSVAARHEHTRHIEANCIIKMALPQPKSESGMSQLFDGRYYEQNASSLCTHSIKISHPYASNSTAVVTLHSPGIGQRDCTQDGVGDQTVSHAAVVKVLRPHFGQIIVQAGAFGPRKALGTYSIDANGRMSDAIRWNAPGLEAMFNWTKLPGATYNKTSNVGPLDDGLGTRKRNDKAFMRWNWALDRISHGRNATLKDTYSHGGALGDGTTLYNLDTGVMISHDDFGGRAVPGFSSGCPTGQELECLTDWVYQGIIDEKVMMRDGRGQGCESHGTHTSSTAAGTLYGVASKAKIVPVQVLGCSGGGTDAAVLEGMEWAANDFLAQVPRRPAVVAMSLGGGARSHVLDAAAKRLNDLGMLVVVAAGNAGTDSCLGSPAGAAEALTVGATGMSEPQLQGGHLIDGPSVMFDQKASFSDDGSCVNIFAPGVEMLAAIPSKDGPHFTSAMSGTSMATPIVAGVALQIWSLHPTLSSEDVTRAIYCLAVPGTIKGVPTHTRNWMVQGGAQLLDPKVHALIARQQEHTPQQRIAHAMAERDATQCFVPPPAEEAAAAEKVALWEQKKVRTTQEKAAATQEKAAAQAQQAEADAKASLAKAEAAAAAATAAVQGGDQAAAKGDNGDTAKALAAADAQAHLSQPTPPKRKRTSLLARRKRTTSFSAFSDDDLGSLKEASEQDDDAMSMGTGMPFSGALQPGREM